ncbi:MAG: hypothetical protein EBZ51_07330 [Synechococcaceae bacterium WB9_2_112]|nr:hypothetical protein [Synechococcaceae bacterium WB9_2_112]
MLHAELTKLPGQLAEALCGRLSDVELLPGQLSDALAQILELLCLLAVDACNALRGLLASAGLLQHQVGDVLVDRGFLARQRALL